MTKANFLVIYCLFISGLCCMANVTKDINMRFKDVRQGLWLTRNFLGVTICSFL